MITDKNDKKRINEIITWTNKNLKPIVTSYKNSKKLNSIEKISASMNKIGVKVEKFKPAWNKNRDDLKAILNKYNITLS